MLRPRGIRGRRDPRRLSIPAALAARLSKQPALLLRPRLLAKARAAIRGITSPYPPLAFSGGFTPPEPKPPRAP